MDIFKLLTRSSNLQKSGPALSQHKIPSSGTPNQGKPAPDVDYVLTKRVNNKRKREKDQIDGFGRSEFRDLSNTTAEGNQAPRHPSIVVSQEQSNEERNTGMVNDGLKGSLSPMSEDECRRILKQHKLKITLLNAENISPSLYVKNDKKDRVPPKENRRKDTSAQLTPVPLTSFGQLKVRYGISKRLAENLDHQGYIEPTAVQIGSLPILLGMEQDCGLPSREPNKKSLQRSEVDLLTIAPTGSGKTLAFLVHVIQGLLEDFQRRKGDVLIKRREHGVQALIIAPTHELANQIVNEGRRLMVGTGLKISGMKKGMKPDQLRLLSSKASGPQFSNSAEGDIPEPIPESQDDFLVKTDILVSTPMILLNSISSTPESIPNTLPGIRYLVLDEADILLDPLFRTQTLSIWSACTNPALKTSLWSATIGSSVESLAMSFIMDRRNKLKLPSSNHVPHHIIRLVVGLKDSSIPNVSHRLIYAATEQGKLLALRQMLHPAAVSAGDAPSIQPPFLIFTQTISRAIALHSELLYDIPLEAGGSTRIAVLHSDLSDTVRAAIMAGFRRGEVWVLITTDLLSRGVDFRGLNGVVNYDIPTTGAAYIHRAGRTGRQQREGGIVVTFYTKEDIPYVKNVANVIARSERLKRKDGNDKKDLGMEKWLLDALPTVSKKTRKELKIKGVESRRIAVRGEQGNRVASKMRISTKSGYDRKLDNRHKEILANNRRKLSEKISGRNESDESWGGISD